MSYPKTVRVQVTAQDIAKAEHSNTECPVALAMNRDVPFGSGWRITRALYGRKWVGVAEVLGLGVRVRLSEAVGRFTADFDDGKPVQPFAFRVWR